LLAGQPALRETWAGSARSETPYMHGNTLLFPATNIGPCNVWTVLCMCHGRRDFNTSPQCGQFAKSHSTTNTTRVRVVRDEAQPYLIDTVEDEEDFDDEE